jgi:2,4-dienoyl-CoA reductase (NADPH2)
MRLPVEIVRRTREAVGPDFILIYRLSMLDLIPDGSTWEEAVTLAKAIAAAGATIINTGIGWHEARVPTIATSVPRAAFTWVTQRMRAELRGDGIDIPLVTTNRINTPDVAEKVLAEGSADMVSMARPLLADAFFVTKAKAGQADRINTCIACNQACLDHAFKNRTVSCLVNPRAGHERDLVIAPATTRKRIAVVGAGPAGLAAATTLAERGHEVDLFDAADEIGGQFNLAKRIPGKEEFHETLRYFSIRIEDTGVRLHLSTRVSAEDLVALGVDEVVLATGVTPRDPHIPGQDSPHVLSYIDVLAGDVPVGQRVAIVGAGGIGFDVAEFLVVAPGESPTLDLAEWRREWGVGDPAESRGGLVTAQPVPAIRKLTLLQRKRGKLGAGLGKTTGWIHRSTLVAKGVTMLPGVNYERITADGVVVSFGEKHEREHLVEADTIVLCAGQEPLRELEPALVAAGIPVHVIGGAHEAAELDAKRAIDQGTRVAAAL